nr:MAG TPA: hypothetical protein [Caudoviricetes sp.]
MQGQRQPRATIGIVNGLCSASGTGNVATGWRGTPQQHGSAETGAGEQRGSHTQRAGNQNPSSGENVSNGLKRSGVSSMPCRIVSVPRRLPWLRRIRSN